MMHLDKFEEKHYRLKLRILDLDESTDHVPHAEPRICQLLPLIRSDHSAQCLHKCCLKVMI